MTVALQTEGLVKRYGGLLATDAVSLRLQQGELHAIIGPNGAGKSTLIGQIGGDLRPDAGQVQLHGKDITALPTWQRALRGLGRSYQISSTFPEFCVQDCVALAWQAHQGHGFGSWRALWRRPGCEAAVLAALDQAHLRAQAERPVRALAHGQRRQLELAMVLVAQPRVLLLDEPMAGMGHAESQQVVSLLQGLKGRYSLLLVEHDMQAVFALADTISVLVNGRIIASGRPAEIREDPVVRSAYLGDEELPA